MKNVLGNRSHGKWWPTGPTKTTTHHATKATSGPNNTGVAVIQHVTINRFGKYQQRWQRLRVMTWIRQPPSGSIIHSTSALVFYSSAVIGWLTSQIKPAIALPSAAPKLTLSQIQRKFHTRSGWQTVVIETHNANCDWTSILHASPKPKSCLEKMEESHHRNDTVQHAAAANRILLTPPWRGLAGHFHTVTPAHKKCLCSSFPTPFSPVEIP